MTMMLNDVCVGDCFRFTDDPDARPSYADTKHNRNLPGDLPPGWEVVDVDDQEESPTWWRNNGSRPVKLLEHYTRAPDPEELSRGHVQPGECFQFIHHAYIDKSLKSLLMVEDQDAWAKTTVPHNWQRALFSRTDLNNRLVRRIPRWDHEGKWTGVPRGNAPAKPYVGTPPVAPLAKALLETAGGLTGEVCLERYEKGMQTESLCRRHGGFVSTLGGHGLDEAQTQLAQRVWALKLAAMHEETRAVEAARAVSVIIDDNGDDPGPWTPTPVETE